MAFAAWEPIKLVFTFLFSFITRWRPIRPVSQAAQNPHPFGTTRWGEFEASKATSHEVMALRIADLEAQVQQVTELVDSLEALTSHQGTTIHNLRLHNRALRHGPTPEVFQRILEDVHTPLKKPAPPGGPDAGSSGPGSTQRHSAGQPARAADRSVEPFHGTATGQEPRAHPGPLTLAQELEAHLDEGSEGEPDDGDS